SWQGVMTLPRSLELRSHTSGSQFSFRRNLMTLKLAFIGTGGIASSHLRGVAEVNQQRGASAERLYELVALADPRAEAREALAAEAETTLGQRPSVYSDYRQMLECEALDVAAFLVPHNL